MLDEEDSRSGTDKVKQYVQNNPSEFDCIRILKKKALLNGNLTSADQSGCR